MIIRKAKKEDKKDLIEISKYAWEDDYIPNIIKMLKADKILSL
ncbi:hypothetical protein [Marinitoga aeolica]|nr:hypothetical protein [Marinitoga aeolica]